LWIFDKKRKETPNHHPPIAAGQERVELNCPDELGKPLRISSQFNKSLNVEIYIIEL
jgi:hypothetical protein